MKITRTSDWSGIVRTMELDVTEEEMLAYARGELVQKAFPRLTEDEREFILTGMSPEEWAAMIDEWEHAAETLDFEEARDNGL